MRYSRNRRGREEASASIRCQDGIATETSTRYQLGKTCVCRSWVGPKRNRYICACSGLVQFKWASRRNFGKITAPKLHLSNHHKTQGKQPIVRILSSPLENPGFPRVFRISGQALRLRCPSNLIPAEPLLPPVGHVPLGAPIAYRRARPGGSITHSYQDSEP